MATRLFFAVDTSPYAPTAGSKSVALPSGTDNSNTVDDSESLLLTANNTATTITIDSVAQLSAQSGRFARFTSNRLFAQTINANTWTIAVDTREGNNNANTFLALSIYVWRPSTNTRVGFIYDSAAQVGIEWTTVLSTVTYTVSGSSIAVNEKDVIVVEIWYTATQDKATSYQNQIRYNTSAQYIETPQDLNFFAYRETRSMWIID
jgi:hypothetical protein